MKNYHRRWSFRWSFRRLIRIGPRTNSPVQQYSREWHRMVPDTLAFQYRILLTWQTVLSTVKAKQLCGWRGGRLRVARGGLVGQVKISALQLICVGGYRLVGWRTTATENSDKEIIGRYSSMLGIGIAVPDDGRIEATNSERDGC